jgi:hypothetical protein
VNFAETCIDSEKLKMSKLPSRQKFSNNEQHQRQLRFAATAAQFAGACSKQETLRMFSNKATSNCMRLRLIRKRYDDASKETSLSLKVVAGLNVAFFLATSNSCTSIDPHDSNPVSMESW